MPIPVTCSNCKASFKASDESAGKRAKCSRCGNPFTIPRLVVVEIEPEPQYPDLASDSELTSGVRKPPIAVTSDWAWVGGVSITAVLAIGFLTWIIFGPKAAIDVAVVAAPAVAEKSPEVAHAPAKTVAAKSVSPANNTPKFDYACSLYAETPERIRELCGILIDKMVERNLPLNENQAIDGSLKWANPGYFFRDKKSEFSEYCTMYAQTRSSKKRSHDEAIHELHVLTHALSMGFDKAIGNDEFADKIGKVSPGCQLAMFECGNFVREDDPVAIWYNALVNNVAGRYGIDPAWVSATTLPYQVKATNNHITLYSADVLEAAFCWTVQVNRRSRGEAPPKFSDFLDIYYDARVIRNKTHKDAAEEFCVTKP